MNSKSNKNLINNKDYLFLTICLILFFIAGFYFLSGGSFPKNTIAIYEWSAGIIISVPVTLYVLKKLTD